MIRDALLWVLGVMLSLLAVYAVGMVCGVLASVFLGGYRFVRYLMT